MVYIYYCPRCKEMFGYGDKDIAHTLNHICAKKIITIDSKPVIVDDITALKSFELSDLPDIPKGAAYMSELKHCIDTDCKDLMEAVKDGQ